MTNKSDAILALDVGAKRIGVAIASLVARLPRPLITLENNETFMPALQDIIEVEGVAAIIVGFPRGLQGQHTAQTNEIEEFTKRLRERFAMPIRFQDESVTSKEAEKELEARGGQYEKGDIDALAATYILEDFLSDKQNLVELEV
ncbi:MAG: Holliday junction resolvase RuvX [Bdellovibrionales bacterium]|nr:Holliday junction resolvase RuvX [Bdellovibrionales bacterium]